MITTPEITVHYPWEGDNSEFSMKSVHNNLVLLHHSMREWYIGLVGIHFCVIRGRGTKSKRIWGPVKPPPPVQCIKKAGIQSSRFNNIVSQLYYYNYFDLTETKILFKFDGQEDTNINIVLKERYHLSKYVSKENGG